MLISHPNVQLVFNEFAENLTAFLIYFIKEENPEVIIIGGNISNASEYFFPMIAENLKRLSFNIDIKKSSLGESAVILGSASLWKEQTLIC